MQRRRFMTSVGGSALSAVLPASAQQSPRLPVVALVFAGIGPFTSRPARAFVDGLNEHGWIDGRSITIVQGDAGGDPRRAPSVIADIIARGVDVIALGGARWLHDAALAATRTVPIVTLFQDDPVAAGLIQSLARPGGNLTGVAQTTGPEIFGKRLQLLRSLAPGIERTAFIGPRGVLAQDRTAAHPGGLAVVPIELNSVGEFEAALAAVRRAGADSLMVAGSAVTYEFSPRLAAFAAENRLPAIYPFREAVDAGGLIAYGTSIPQIFRQMAALADRILKGARPEDLPVEQASTYELLINARTAAALGVAIPQTLLAIADEVVE
jgi:putative ABC transport system substrate-binding protein